ncbi:MAG: hypothetical protein ACPGRZ_14015 [Alphaproteobacteria bacterium]
MLRVLSRFAGVWIGAGLSRAPDSQRRWLGAALLPQAGVAVGMALVAADRFPDLREEILTITIVSTIAFEIFGPVATRLALDKAGETGSEDKR